MEERKNTNPIQSILGLILMVFFLIALWFLARFLFKIFLYLTPVLILIAFILDRKVVINYVKSLWRLTKKNTGMGIGAIVLSILGIPLVSLYLFGRAILGRQLKKAQQAYDQQQQGDFIEYEELEEETLDLSPLEKQQPEPPKAKQQPEPPAAEPEPKEEDTDYEQLFD